jgi:hypothetical protein
MVLSEGPTQGFQSQEVANGVPLRKILASTRRVREHRRALRNGKIPAQKWCKAVQATEKCVVSLRAATVFHKLINTCVENFTKQKYSRPRSATLVLAVAKRNFFDRAETPCYRARRFLKTTIDMNGTDGR